MSQSYGGKYFGANYVSHIYEPTEKHTKHLLENFKFKYEVGQNVRFRHPHRKSKQGTIKMQAYTTYGSFGGQMDGATVKVYLINNEWVYEGRVKEII